MPIISKLPQSEEIKLSEKNPPFGGKAAPQRQFLTKPSSWAKLIVGFAIVGLVVWFNVMPDRKSKIENRKSTSGQVAGAQTQDDSIMNQELSIKNIQENNNQGEQKETQIEGLPPIEFPIPQINSDLDKTILASEDIRLLFKTGSDALDKEDLNLAQLAYIRITQIAPEYKDAWYYLGYSYLKKFEIEPIIKYANPAPTNLDWAIVALNRAHLIAPQSEPIIQLLKKAQNIKKDNQT